ncbi:hypothetical protein AKJ16_DCAP04131 [Drosera capensis]
MNKTGEHQLIDLWYDYPNGRNFNIIRSQLDPNILYDLEWNNGSTFYYTLVGEERCRRVQMEVGILRPDWLDGAEYVGETMVDGFFCDVWTKADFIVYYEDKETKRPVRWRFYTGREAHVMSFEVGAVLEDAKWQVPYYCFSKKDVGTEHSLSSLPDASGALMNSDFREVDEAKVLKGFDLSRC